MAAPHPVGAFQDLARITAETFVAGVEFHDRLASTNDHALALVAARSAETPLLVLADEQTAGRGRGANRWWSARGALTCTLVVDSHRAGLPTRHWPRVSLTSALAVCETLLPLLPEHDVGLKWPNDVHLQGRKVCGILVEVSPVRLGVLVIGIGLNVNNSFQSAPLELTRTATSLRDTAGCEFDRTEVLVQLLRRLEQRFRQLATDREGLSESWRERCLLQGRTVCLESAGQQFVGVCQGIDDEGALLLQTEGGIQRFFAGVIQRIL